MARIQVLRGWSTAVDRQGPEIPALLRHICPFTSSFSISCPFYSVTFPFFFYSISFPFSIFCPSTSRACVSSSSTHAVSIFFSIFCPFCFPLFVVSSLSQFLRSYTIPSFNVSFLFDFLFYSYLFLFSLFSLFLSSYFSFFLKVLFFSSRSIYCILFFLVLFLHSFLFPYSCSFPCNFLFGLVFSFSSLSSSIFFFTPFSLVRILIVFCLLLCIFTDFKESQFSELLFLYPSLFFYFSPSSTYHSVLLFISVVWRLSHRL